MYDLKKMDQIEREFAEQDKRSTAPKFFGIGIVTLAIALAFIYFASAHAIGCTIAVVP